MLCLSEVGYNFFLTLGSGSPFFLGVRSGSDQSQTGTAVVQNAKRKKNEKKWEPLHGPNEGREARGLNKLNLTKICGANQLAMS